MNPAKLHPSLAAAATAKSIDEAPLPVIVRYRQGPISRGEAKTLQSMTVDYSFQLIPAKALLVPAGELGALTEDPAVVLVWPDLAVHAWLDRRVGLVRAPRVWDSGFTGRGVRIAIVDTGVDPDHPDLADRVLAFADFVEASEQGGTRPRDPNGHGTHVAGIAAGSGAASDGAYRGVAPEADLLVARVLDGAGNGRTSHVMAGIEWALSQGAQVVNVSLGGPPYPADGTDAFSQLCDAAVGAGAVVCVAAGNLGPTGHTIGSPAAAARVVTVGASTSTGAGTGDSVAPFSSRGPTGDGRTKPDLVFPGVGIVAPRANGTSLGTVRDDHYTALSGTSQATPMASGAAALLLQANPRLTPDDVKARMRRGARPIPGAEPVAQGAGRGDAYNTFVAAEGRPVDEEEVGATPVVAEPDPRRGGCLPGRLPGRRQP